MRFVPAIAESKERVFTGGGDVLRFSLKWSGFAEQQIIERAVRACKAFCGVPWLMEEEGHEVSVVSAAFERGGLPTPEEPDCPLGSEPWDLYVYHMLKRSGITVELVNSPAYADTSVDILHNTVQIVSAEQIKSALHGTQLDDISFYDADQTAGLQVKLNNAFTWKVSIQDDIPDQGSTVVARSSRKRTVAADAMKFSTAATCTRSSWTVPQLKRHHVWLRRSPSQ